MKNPKHSGVIIMNWMKTISAIEYLGLWETLNNKDKLFGSYMYLNECSNSKDSGMYQLILNGCELWYGTLLEINAILKSMIVRIEKEDFID